MKAMVDMFTTGDLSELNATVDGSYVDHQGLGGEPERGADGFARVVEAARSGYQDLVVTIEDLITAPDRAVARLRWRGTRRSSGQEDERETIEIVRIERAKAVEHWGAHS
jgi:predicted ester cyclase